MSEQIKDGGPAFPCMRSGCNEPSVRKQGRQWLCPKHYRFGQMRATARRHGKVVPTHEHLENVFSCDRLTCRDCKRAMNWMRADGAASQITLQHYRSGSMGFVCLSCNSRHAGMEGDSYCAMPADHKRCPTCKAVKSSSEFTKDLSRSGDLQRKSACKSCSNSAASKWKEINRERYNAYQREYRAKQKERVSVNG